MARIHTDIPPSLTRQTPIDLPPESRPAPRADPAAPSAPTRGVEDSDTAQLRSASDPRGAAPGELLDVSTAAQVAELLRATLLNLPVGGAAAIGSPDPASVWALIR